MFRKSLLLCSVPAVLSIIVTDPPPLETDYKYAYSIEDPSTGDSKSQHEVRRGDVVTGAYSVLGPDGTKRTVEYTADSKHGFNVILREEPAMDVHSSRYIQEPTKYRDHISDVSQPLIQELPQYTRLLQKSAYLIQKLPMPYAKENRDIILFTPANEIKTDRLIFEHGKYFEPATK